MQTSSTPNTRMPALFLPHGGGPWPWMASQREAYARMRAYMEGLLATLPTRPRAVLVVSAHWETPEFALMTSAQPPMLYDYSGFPAHTYEVTWPAPGAVDLAGEVEALLAKARFSVRRDGARGFDHGTFVPMSLVDPSAELPTLQVSLKTGLDPETHLRLGRALAPLRQEGVLLLGSGMSYHNMRAFAVHMRGGPAPSDDSRAFDEWLVDTVAQSPDVRDARLAEWHTAPRARECHPREEHLLPLHVIAGAAGTDPASIPYQDTIIGAQVSAVQFG